jgi:bacillithiol synthase
MSYEVKHISFNETSLLNPLVNDYLLKKEILTSFYTYSPNAKGLLDAQKGYSRFTSEQRKIIVDVLMRQAGAVTNTSQASHKAIQSLLDDKTYTVTTGHQLCVFTGPLYFIYKILSTINLAETLKRQFPENNYVPVYWMASEDHDIEEIQNFRVYGKALKWETQQQGATGNLSTEGLKEVADQLKTILGESEQAKELVAIFEKAYLKETNIARATRILVNELFGKYDLVVMDGDEPALKQLFIHEFEKDIFEEKTFPLVNQTIQSLENLGYTIQVKPRPINVFYLAEQFRGRIEKTGTEYQIVNTDIRFSEQELSHLLKQQPEKFSPNVVLRPLYQQKLLPNIAYIGGPGELAYWLEYKSMFDAFELNMPVLLPRQFVSLIEKNIFQKIQKLELAPELFFQSEKNIVDTYLQQQAQVFDLEVEKKEINMLFEKVKMRVLTIDKSLEGTIGAENQKVSGGLDTISAKVNKALKQKSEQELKQIQTIKSKLFPDSAPQERVDNFAQYALKYGVGEWIEEVKNKLVYTLEEYKVNLLIEQ